MHLFRVAVGPKDGLGHITRVNSLAKILKLKNYKIVIEKNYSNFFKTTETNKPINLYPYKKNYTSELDDAKLFIKLIKDKKNTVVIIDNYKLGYVWEKYVSKFCKKIICIDDFINKKHYADIYINYSPLYIGEKKNIIKKLKKYNKKSCSFLLGPQYALFDRSFKKMNFFKKSKIKNITFYNGGSGNVLIYKKIIKNLIKLNKEYNINIIVGPYAPNYKNVLKQFGKHKNISIKKKKNNILDVVNNSRILVCSAGIITYESAFLKIPTLLIRMNENQNLNTDSFEKLGHYFHLNKTDLQNTNKVCQLILLIIKNNKMITDLMSKSEINLKKINTSYFASLN